jgi:hypothetical protein
MDFGQVTVAVITCEFAQLISPARRRDARIEYPKQATWHERENHENRNKD